MKPQEVVEYLKRVPMFQELTDDVGELELYRIVPLVQEEEYGEGEVLFQQGEPAHRLHIIKEGMVRLSRTDPQGVTRHVSDLRAGDSVGATGLLVGDFHDTTAEVLQPTELLYVEQSDFADLLGERPRLRRHLVLGPELVRRMVLPDFDWMRDDELVIFYERRHWFHLLRRTAPVLLVLLLLLPLMYFLITFASLFATLLAFFVGVIIVGFLGLLAWQYLNWRDDYFVLTTERIVHYERVWPVREAFEEGALEKIEDAYVIQSGIVANALNFGDLVLLTAGETVEIDMTNVPHPGELREMIFREMERQQAREVLRVRGRIRERLLDRLRAEPAQPLPPEVTMEEGEPPSARLLLDTVKDYFFPPSWVESDGGKTIRWRRYWLPWWGQHIGYVFGFVAVTLGGLGVLLYPLLQNRGEGVSVLEVLTQSNVSLGEYGWRLIAWLLAEAIIFAVLLWYVEDWRNDYFEVTPNRVILVFRKPLLLQVLRRETVFQNIQNISFVVPNFVARIFDYGHVMLETAAEAGVFQLKWVRHPARIQAEISRRKQEFSRRQREAEAQRRQEELLRWFDMYDALRHPSERMILREEENDREGTQDEGQERV
jgi:hypothetical protein